MAKEKEKQQPDNSDQTTSDDHAEKSESAASYKLGDDLIAVVRELLQLSILTGTNIVDHLRAVTAEVNPDTGKLVPTDQYVGAYNEMITELVKKAEQANKQTMQQHVLDAAAENDGEASN